MPIKIGIVLLLILGLVFFFWPGHPPYQFLESLISESLISGKPSQPRQTSQTQSKTKLNSHQTPQLVNIEFNAVAKEDEEKIREGIRIMDFYLNGWFGHSVKDKVSIKVDASSQTSSLADGENGEMVALLHTQEPIWQMLRQFITQYKMDMRSRFAAHEYVHYYQKDFGCGRIYKPEQVKLKWLMEGEAEWLSYKATLESGNLSSFLSLEQLLSMTVQGGNLQPLKTYEKEAEVGVQLYSYFALAVNLLMKNKDIKTLDNYCANVGKGQEAAVAFENAFGMPLEKFYSDFETYYKNLAK